MMKSKEIRRTPLYRKLTTLLGARVAMVQVKKVLESNDGNTVDLQASFVGESFIWISTPQGKAYWKRLDKIQCDQTSY